MDWTFLDSSRTTLHELDIAFRLLLAALAGAVIGFDRETKNQAAGLRTHMLVALAAAVFTILTFEIYQHVQRTSTNASSDPIRIVEAVTAGVAFLAAGTIIQGRGNVQGLTTGAAMWMAGALGVACGVGYYGLALIAVVMTYLILSLMKWLVGNYLKGEDDEPPREKLDQTP